MFGEDLWKSKEALTPAILEKVSKEKRIEVLNSLNLKDESHGAYLYLYPASEAVPMFIQKIKRCPDVRTRQTMVADMVSFNIVFKWAFPLV